MVVDASVLLAGLVDAGPVGDWARTQLADPTLAASELLPAEVTSGLRKAERLGLISAAEAVSALNDLADLPVELYPWRLIAGRVWELRHNLTPYDAWYVGLAELLEQPLVTLDRSLARAPGIRCDVRLGPGS